MKKLALLFMFAWIAIGVSAQAQVNWSLKMGLGASNWMGSASDDAKAKLGYKLGVGVELPIDGYWSFQTGLNLVGRGAKGEEGNADITVKQTYLELPLMAALHLGTENNFDVIVSAGPYMAYGVGGKIKAEYSGVETSIDTFGKTTVGDETFPGFRRFDLGLGGGVALDFPKWVVGMDVQFGLIKLQAGEAPRNMSFFITAGYKF